MKTVFNLENIIEMQRRQDPMSWSNTDIDLSANKLDLLPKTFDWCGGDFSAHYNNLTSLENIPFSIHGNLDLSNNQLTSVDGFPKSVLSTIDLSFNKISCLKGLAKYREWTKLKDYPNTNFLIRNNELKSFEYFPAKSKNIICQENKIESLVGIHKIILQTSSIEMFMNPVVEGGIGLIFIDGLHSLYATRCGSFSQAALIITKYLGQGKAGLLACQHELCEAGLEQYARL